MNVVEKIIAAHCGEESVSAGQIVNVVPDHIMVNDATGALTIDIFENQLRGESLANRKKVIMVLDHFTPSSSIAAADSHGLMRRFASEHGIEHFYDGKGGCHQLMMENHVCPGELVIGADSHTCSYGALGALATGMGSTDVAAAWAQGSVWMKVPETMEIVLKGELKPFVGAKDLILRIIGDIGANGATYKALTFSGEIIEVLSLSSRMTLANMAIEAGAKFAYIAPDDTTRAFLRDRGRLDYCVYEDDDETGRREILEYDVSDLVPQVAVPHSVDQVKGINEVIGTEIDEVFIGACTNGRFEDLQEAAERLRGKKVARSCRCIVTPASNRVLSQALEAGLVDIFVDSGAMVTPPGCSTCFGGSGGILGKGEKLLTTANRNFRGRVGSYESEIYLASPAVAAASAVNGCITDPRRTL